MQCLFHSVRKKILYTFKYVIHIYSKVGRSIANINSMYSDCTTIGTYIARWPYIDDINFRGKMESFGKCFLAKDMSVAHSLC